MTGPAEISIDLRIVCGAGGTTRGAKSAGLEVIWGLDYDKNAGLTWRWNFPDAEHFELWTDEFARLPDSPHRFFVDVLHLSPPCQVFSPIHVVPGKDDQQNHDSLFACEEIIKKARPRMITLEQTFGILHPKFETRFNTLIQMFTSHGFSTSWQIVELKGWGLPQTRKRLIIMAAGYVGFLNSNLYFGTDKTPRPGELLPDIPPQTHSTDPVDGLPPLTSVNSVLRSIPRVAANHDLREAILRTRNGRCIPWDGTKLAKSILCNGRQSHPSGERFLTNRELATLQGFPLDHVFKGTRVQKQIGNAVPPLIAEILFSHIIKHLQKTDGVENEVVVID